MTENPYDSPQADAAAAGGAGACDGPGYTLSSSNVQLLTKSRPAILFLSAVLALASAVAVMQFVVGLRYFAREGWAFDNVAKFSVYWKPIMAILYGWGAYLLWDHAHTIRDLRARRSQALDEFCRAHRATWNLVAIATVVFLAGVLGVMIYSAMYFRPDF
jgi:hypothetical protein